MQWRQRPICAYRPLTSLAHPSSTTSLSRHVANASGRVRPTARKRPSSSSRKLYASYVATCRKQQIKSSSSKNRQGAACPAGKRSQTGQEMPAVDGNDRTRHIGRSRRQHEQQHGVEVLHATEAPLRDALGERRPGLARQEAAIEIGLHIA